LGAIGLDAAAEDRTGNLSRGRAHEGSHLRGKHACSSHCRGVRRVGGDWKKAKSGENEGRMEVKQKGVLEP